MSRYETYRSNASEAPSMRRWIFAALILSLSLHGFLMYLFFQHRLEGFGIAEDRLAPPIRVSMQRVAIPDLPDVDETRIKVPTNAAKMSHLQVPSDKPEVGDVRVAPQITELPKVLPNEKPKVDMTAWENLAKTEGSSREKELGTAVATLLRGSNRASAKQPVINVPRGITEGDGLGTAGSIPGMKSVDEMLAQTGPLKAGDKAGMPGGALFEYNSYELRAEAQDQLRLLGALIQQHPTATFSIEGHTDSFGTPDYNQRLSEARAESVKAWLVAVMRIAPERIQTIGFGNAKPIVTADKTKEEQAPNRRVEIVVKTSRKS